MKSYAHSATGRRRLLPTCAFAVSALALTVPQILAGGAAHATSMSGTGAGHTAGITTPRQHPVATVSYDLGDRAYRLPETGEPVELAASVHYPRDLGAGPYPLVVVLHGWHETCADREAETARAAAQQAQDWDAYEAAGQKLFAWPCAPGTAPIASDRGYDYLGENLAAQGFVVVSVSANGINASSVSGDENASARAGLINRHLALWQRLNSTGGGPLAGRFRDRDTGKPVGVRLAAHVDLSRVGTLGHSRGGAGVTWQAADSHRSQWPDGVRVGAVLALAPAYNVMTEDMSAYTLTGTPMAVVRGTCDGQVGTEAFAFAGEATAGDSEEFLTYAPPGANHNYFNTRWSPMSGEVAAADGDAVQLTEKQQRRLGTEYAVDFFRRHLDDGK
ncbi:alpha/beta hydrolase [Streptomyces kunmingensis]|uniref:Alpha/beta hydrolase n=1 Tax=Streptomyces kunmingensis TaxID=68225 RepID=A0ABU6CN45_9ACTN|nr:alpha/beta hydrolase [Streptomyces kunmingensis]MEB3966149.1 alpha/beta hydrolase [Streptomyces kunmingensis]